MGVRRAVEIAEREIALQKSVFTLGPLIHNPQVLRSLEDRGVKILDEKNIPAGPGGLAGKTVIIRAHGVKPETEARLVNAAARIVDATCPKVKASQLAARTLAETGAAVFIAGERNHAEVIGIAGYAAGARVIIAGSAAEAREEAEKLAACNKEALTALLAQTTFSEEEYREAAKAIKEFFPRLMVKHTICRATRDRQDALRELCTRCEGIVVAGGRESANTRRLAAIAQSCGKPACVAESAAGLDEIPFLKNVKTAGLCAGASTPGGVIEEIASALYTLPL
jgi:4-hydroxy-3-methylbut-2-enyl diphosphate reductase